MKQRELEDLTSAELAELARHAGKEASERAFKRGHRISKFIKDKLYWVYPDGRPNEEIAGVTSRKVTEADKNLNMRS